LQAGGGWGRREREWSCKVRARSKEGALGRGHLIFATRSLSSAWGIQGAWDCWAGAAPAGVQDGEGFLTASRRGAGNRRQLAGLHGRQAAKGRLPGRAGMC